jgi:sec-independent protein translocase protein TatA
MIGDIMQPTHLLFVLAIALLVLGPKRLPEVGRQLGNGIRDFRAAINGERREHEEELDADSQQSGAEAELHAGSEQNGAEAGLHHPPAAQPVEHEEAAAQPVEHEASAAQPVDHQFAHESVEPAGDQHQFAHEPARPADKPVDPLT